jgi:hypothetical protein
MFSDVFFHKNEFILRFIKKINNFFLFIKKNKKKENYSGKVVS